MLLYFRMAFLWIRRSNLTSEKGKMLKIITPMIMFLIHMYLWGIGTVFLSRYPQICNLTNVELGGGNWVLAEANCSTSSSRWSYFQFTCICEIVTLYFSANAFLFQNGISLEPEVKFDFWKRENLSECWKSSSRWSYF